MKAIGMTTFGGPEVLRVFELPDPLAGSGEVRIRVHATSVNPTDTLFRAGSQAARLSGRPGPYVPGMDTAGVIDELGPETDSRLKVGDRVVAFVIPAGPHGGAYAEYVVVPEASVVLAPAGVDFPAASTLLLNGLTARLALDALALDSGHWSGWRIRRLCYPTRQSRRPHGHRGLLTLRPNARTFPQG